jgi:hypothetical protein
MNCQTAVNSICTACISTYFLDNTDINYLVCTACGTGCSTCDSPTVCTVCQTSFFKENTACTACGTGCGTCTTPTDCSACTDPINYVLDSTFACVSKATAHCSTASSSACLTCNSQYFKDSSNTGYVLCTICPSNCT